MGQASPYEVIPSQNKIKVFINTKNCSHRGSPTNLSFTYSDYVYSKFYCGRLAASADGTVDEDEGSSLPVRMTFGSIGGGMMLTFDLVSTPSTGWTTSSWCTSLSTLEWRASITHCAVTCSATICAYGTKLSPSAWISSMLHPLVYLYRWPQSLD